MKVLVIGGSVFLGRAMVDEALAAGHEVTVFNRGVSGPPPPAGVESVTGDRTVAADLEPLRGRQFDLVIDTCGYVPAEVALSADLLAPTSGHYAFVSSINVFPDWPDAVDYRISGLYDSDPDATRADAPDAAKAYGWLKVGCEQAVVRSFGPERCSLLRGGSIVGPNDSQVARLTWWIDRVSRGGEVLVPGQPDAFVSLIDSRDLALFALKCVPGAFETPGPDRRDTRAELMIACAVTTASDATFTYVDEDWLAAQGVGQWTEVPLWALSHENPSVFSHHAEDTVAAGLTWRPLAETVADTWAWRQGVEWQPSTMTPGLTPGRERELLAAWHARAE